MDCAVKLKLEINLRKFSAITVITTLWDHDKIKSKIKKYFADCKTNPHKQPDDHKWQTITSQVSDQIRFLCLPQELKTFLQPFVKVIGEKIFFWNMFVHRCLTLEGIYTYKIYWTSFGTINEIKIFEKYWVPVGMETRKQLQNTDIYDCSIFILACLLIQKQFIRQNIHQILEETSQLLELEILGKLSVYAIIVIWICTLCGEKDKALDLYKKVKQSGNVDNCMFMLCVSGGLFEAAKYFWNRLTQNEKDDIIIEAAERCLQKVLSNEISKDKSFEILIFLINNMNLDIQKKFFHHNFIVITQSFMTTWPFQEMYEQILNGFFNDLVPENVELILHRAFCRSMNDDEDFFSKNMYRQILPKIYKINPRDNKVIVLFKDLSLMNRMIDKLDVSYLSLILNDPDLSDYKEKVLELGTEKMKSLIKSKDLRLLNKLTQTIFQSKKQEKEFMIKINILPELLTERNYELADEFLNWLADSDEEKTSIKQEIDPIKIYSQAKNFTWLWLDELLLWLYDVDDKWKNAKQSMKENQFICDKIIMIWNENGKEGKRKCVGFLNWLSDCSKEEESALKKKLIIDENFVKKFINALPSSKAFSSINDLLAFLSVPPEKVLEIKENIIKNIDNYISPYVVTQNNFKLADAILNWVSRDEQHKKENMKTYINSLKGAMLLMKSFLKCNADNVEPLLSILKKWVKPYGNENKIMERLNLIDVENILEIPESHSVDRLVFLLGFTKTERITNSFIKNVFRG